MARATRGSKDKKAVQPSTKRASTKASTKEASSKEDNQASKQIADIPEGIQLPAASGKVGVFGGPKDRGIKPDDKLALPTGPHSTYERVRSLNPKSFYCAMRWDYHIQHMSPEEENAGGPTRRFLSRIRRTANP